MSDSSPTGKDLPSGWSVSPLEDVADILDGKRVPVNAKERETRTGKVPYYGATGQVGWIDDYLFDEELVLLGEDGAPFLDASKPKAYVIRGKSWVNNHAHVLRAKDGTPNAYLKYFLDRFDYHGFVTGTTRLKLTQGSMRQIPIPLPSPEDRKRIVAEIEKQFSRLDEAVASLKRTKANLKRYKAAVLKAAVEGCLTRMKVGSSRQHEVTRGWRQATVGEAIQIIDYRGRTPPFSNSGIPHLRSSNIKGGRIVWENLAYVTGQTYAAYMTRGLPQEGDVLFTTEAPLGEVALAPKEEFSIAQRMMILRPKPELLRSRFLMFQLMSPQFHAKLRHRGTGSTVTGVSSRNFQPLPLLIPPIEEQEGIADEVERRLSVIEELEAVVQANLIRAERLRQAILGKAFTGQLVRRKGCEKAC